MPPGSEFEKIPSMVMLLFFVLLLNSTSPPHRNNISTSFHVSLNLFFQVLGRHTKLLFFLRRLGLTLATTAVETTAEAAAEVAAGQKATESKQALEETQERQRLWLDWKPETQNPFSHIWRQLNRIVFENFDGLCSKSLCSEPQNWDSKIKRFLVAEYSCVLELRNEAGSNKTRLWALKRKK